MPVKTTWQTWQAIVAAGEAKSKLAWHRAFVLGILAGCFIGFGGLSAITVGLGAVQERAENPGLAKLHFAAVFPVGLVLVVLTGAELVTGNFMAMTALVLERSTPLGRREAAAALARNWAVVWLANLVGSVALAYFLCFLGGLFNDPVYRVAVAGLAERKAATTPLGQIFVRAIGCNWLVCLAIWCQAAADDVISKILAIWFPISTFVIVGFEHSVANMFFLPLGYFYGARVTWAQIVWRNLLTVTVGNVIGGALFCSGVFHYAIARHPANVAAAAAAAASAAEQGAVKPREGTPLGSIVRHYPASDGRTLRVEVRADVLRELEAGRADSRTPAGAEAEFEYRSFGPTKFDAEGCTADAVDGFLRTLAGRLGREVLPSGGDLVGTACAHGHACAAPAAGPLGGAGAPPRAPTDVA